jgi:hypothetical protein
MSELLRFLLKLMRHALLGTIGLLVVFVILLAWQKFQAGTLVPFTRSEDGIFIVLAIMLIGAVWMWRAIGRELNRPDP